jgi:histidinol-phosphate aminotransferase
MTREEFISLRNEVENNVGDASKELKLNNYKVDNAIIMAAGYSARCMPLSEVMPKGLFKVKGERLIDREIEQLKAAGIDQIIVVTGYKHEMFDYLKDKYGVIIVHNEFYNKYNNIGSLYVAKDYMANSYILCCDNYYVDNVFYKYVYEPYYSCVYSEQFCDEFCVTSVDNDGYITGITRGGDRSWYTIGDCYFDRNFSKTFLSYLEKEWDEPETKNLLMDDFHIRHIDKLPLYLEKRDSAKILEFDTVREIIDFDPEFVNFQKENLTENSAINQVVTKFSEVKAYHSVPTEQQYGRLHLNENLWGPSPKCLEVLKSITMEDLCFYDLRKKDALVEALSKQTGISESNIFVHNGSAEVIKSIFTILLSESDKVLIPAPGWSYYKSVADAKFAKCIEYGVIEEEDTYKYDIDDVLTKAKEYAPKLIVLTSPQMPTGCSIDHNSIERVIKENPEAVVMLDEAYWGFADDSNEFEHDLVMTYSNVVITRTFSKFYGLADIRIGYGLCSYPLRQTIGLDLPLFKSCGISRKIAIAAIEDIEYYKKVKEESVKVREWFSSELNKIEGVTAYKSASNFVFIKINNADAKTVRAFMEENGILIRLFTDKDALRLRITIAPREIMERVLVQLKKALEL